MKSFKVGGIIPPIITPLADNEKVDEKAFVRQINRLLEAGVHGLFLLGSNGEFVSLSNAERIRALKLAVSEVNKRVPIISGTMDLSTKRTIENAEIAQEVGVDAIASAYPSYYPPHNDIDIIAHYEQLAKNVDLPVFIYNIPINTKVMVKADVIKKLSAVDNIVGAKDSSGDWTNFIKLLFSFRGSDSFSLLLGGPITLGATAVLLGADGIVSGLTNVAPKLAIDVYEAAKAKDIERLYQLQVKLDSLSRILSYGAPIVCVKTALEIMGICSSRATLPFQPLSESAKAEIKKILDEHELL